MKLSASYIVAMAGNNVNAGSALVVPNSDGLIITAGQDPRELFVEESCSDIINMTFENKITSFLFIVPDSYLSLISTRDKEREMRMKVDASNWIFMILSDEMDTSNLAMRIFML